MFQNKVDPKIFIARNYNFVYSSIYKKSILFFRVFDDFIYMINFIINTIILNYIHYSFRS